jgi:hypothetical protein
LPSIQITQDRNSRVGAWGLRNKGWVVLLSTARFVNAARVDPGILPSIRPRLGTASSDLGVACHIFALSILQVLERHLFLIPPVREDRIIWHSLAKEQFEVERGRIDETHPGEMDGLRLSLRRMPLQ